MSEKAASPGAVVDDMAPMHLYFDNLRHLQFVVSENSAYGRNQPEKVRLWIMPHAVKKILDLASNFSGQHMILALEQWTAIVSESAQAGSRWPRRERKWTGAGTRVPVRDDHN
jgi:hypothetical protein